MAGEWFLARSGQQTLGPITAQQLKQMADEGQVRAGDLVWKPGMPKWAPAAQIKGLLTGPGDVAGASPPPEPVGAQEVDWRTAGPPREAAAPPAVPPEAGPLAPAHEVPEGAEAEREPWYYRFLERYAKVALVLGAVLCVLGFAWLVVAALLAAGQGGAGLVGALLAALFGVPALLLTLLVLVLQLALVLLAVDAARNLRALRRQQDKHG